MEGVVPTPNSLEGLLLWSWSMVSAYVLPPAGTPLGAQLGCARWVVVALNERLQRAGSEGLKPHSPWRAASLP